MAVQLPPIPQDQIGENHPWRDWFRNLGNYIQAAQGGGVIWAISQGGTGSSTAQGARSNLGIGTMGVQNSDNVAITGGSISGVVIPYTDISGLATVAHTGSYADISGLATVAHTGAYSDLSGTPTGLSVTITTAKLTTLGTNGSMTFTNGILTSQTQAT